MMPDGNFRNEFGEISLIDPRCEEEVLRNVGVELREFHPM